MSHWFGIHPWHYDLLTSMELEAYVAALRDVPPIGGLTGPYEPRG